jgi:hypothetical protein
MIRHHRVMNDRHPFGPIMLSVILSSLALVSVASAAETFKARMMTGKTGFGPTQINVRIEVESWTTLDEINRLQDALVQGGFNAYQDAFNAMKKGTARFMSDHGRSLPIHAALSVPTEKGRKIHLFFNHQTWDTDSTFVEHSGNPFMVIEITLDDKGKGDGHFYEFAQIKLRPELGTIEMESYEAAPKILSVVQDVTKKK